MLIERAGGGHSFSGGGGGFSGGGGGGIHTGPIFVGGGYGGGGGSALIGFLIIGVIILLVVVFLVSKARHQGRLAGITPHPYPTSNTAAYSPGSFPVDIAPGAAPVSVGPEAGIAAIQAHDPEFNIETFKSSVERSFFVVEEAWSELKPDMSRRVMADGLWQQHRTQIQGYQTNGTRNVLDGLAVGRVDLMSASTDDQFDTITVRIFAACADYDINVASGKVVRGNKKDMENWQEDWIFQRSSKATTKAGGGTMQERCPNCGAPLDVDLAGVCTHCRAPIMSGQYDWVLTRIDQV
jgi:predicted lipid-binding transport protein (Tim44 family)